jgi:DNA-directed RNA polymerase subunit alpha
MHIRWRGLELPSVVTCDQSTLTMKYGKFSAEPFERGFGSTIGNSLRRVMLSSLEGAAVTQVKVGSTQHEFTTIAGVMQDVTDIILNIKALVVKKHTSSTKVLRVERKTAGDVRASDIETDSEVDIINGDHLLATLTDDVPFELEMVVENGRGYVPAVEHSTRDQEIGIIPVDAVFSPVLRVRYDIEETRVGQKTNYDRLTLEIWTDGSIQPEMALVEAAKILRKHLNPFVQFSELGLRVSAAARGGTGGMSPEVEARLNMTLSEMRLSVRASNCLESENIMTVRDLVTRNEDQLLEVRNFGETTLNEVREKLNELGLHLGMRIPSSSGV